MWSLAVAVAAVPPAAPRQHHPIDPTDVRRVHLVQSNRACAAPAPARPPPTRGADLDIGFSDYIPPVLNRYLTGGWGTEGPPHPRSARTFYDSFLLNAANTSRILRGRNGTAAYLYTTHPWILHLFFHCDGATFPRGRGVERLRCPTRAQRAALRAAMARGDTAMQAFAHSAEPELFDAATFEAGLQLAPALLAELGLGRAGPTVMQQRDVPGLTRGAVPLLARHGVRGLSVGANDGSPAPVLPSTVDCANGWRQVRTPFVWRDAASGAEVLADVHPGGYGGQLPLIPGQNISYYGRDGLLCNCVGVPSLGDVMCYAFRGDNYGPADAAETELNFDIFGSAFPNARVEASTLDAFFAALEPHRGRLPVVTAEIGDTWLYGSGSDPAKTAAMRAMMRHRTACVRRGRAACAEPHLEAFTHLLLKLGEHTWGGSYAGHMNVTQPDRDWDNAGFEAARAASLAGADGSDPFYRVAENTWDEQRQFITAALAALDSGPPSELAAAIRSELAAVAAPPPSVEGMARSGYEEVPEHLWASRLRLGPATATVDRSSGGLDSLSIPGHGDWAAEGHPLFRFLYRTLSYDDKCHYARTYRYSHGGEHP